MIKKLTDKQYREHAALSQSQLKLFLNGYDCYVSNKEKSHLYFEDKKHFNIGSAVDVLCTEGLIAYNQQFVQINDNKPSEAIMSILQKMADENKDFTDKNIIQSCKDHEFYKIHLPEKSSSIPTAIKKVREWEKYYDFLF